MAPKAKTHHIASQVRGTAAEGWQPFRERSPWREQQQKNWPPAVPQVKRACARRVPSVAREPCRQLMALHTPKNPPRNPTARICFHRAEVCRPPHYHWLIAPFTPARSSPRCNPPSPPDVPRCCFACCTRTRHRSAVPLGQLVQPSWGPKHWANAMRLVPTYSHALMLARLFFLVCRLLPAPLPLGILAQPYCQTLPPAESIGSASERRTPADPQRHPGRFSQTPLRPKTLGPGFPSLPRKLAFCAAV